MSDDDAYDDYDLNMTGRMTHVKTSTAALDICNGILAEPQVIGVKVVGKDLGAEKGKIYLVAFAKCDGNAFLFDLKLNPEMMKNGHLKHVFETITVIKVMYRARSACLTVFKEFHFQIQNVFDTEIAHAIIEAQKLGCSPFEVELKNLNYISDYYGCGWRNKYRDRISACLKKNKNFFGHRPLSKPAAEFVASDAALLVPLIFTNMDKMINPCNRGLFNKLCSIRICADESKLRQNKETSSHKSKKLKENMKRRLSSKMYKSPDPLCKKCGKPRSLHPKKSGNCPSRCKRQSQMNKRNTSTSHSYRRLRGGNIEQTGTADRCELVEVCSRGSQTSEQPCMYTPSSCVPPCPPIVCSSTYTSTPVDNCHPQTPYIRCYGHTENVPTSWQLVQVAGMDVDYLCLKASQPERAPKSIDQSVSKCTCCDVACNTEESSNCSLFVNANSEECTEFETDSEAMLSDATEESCEEWSESEESDLY